MGRRRSRKLERRSGKQFRGSPDRFLEPSLFARDHGDPFVRLFDPAPTVVAPPAPRTCSGCREFVEDAEGGRGTCLHPGSGFLSPWTDTQACSFYATRRR